MKKINLLVAICLFFSCCSSDHLSEIVIKNYASLKLNVVDAQGNGVENANILVYDNQSNLLVDESTDLLGGLDCGEVLSGTYSVRVYVDKLEEENLMFTENKNFQIVNDVSKTVTINPFENVGELNVTVTKRDSDTYETVPAQGVEVFVIMNELFSDWEYYSHSDFSSAMNALKSLTAMQKTSDSQGMINFSGLPANFAYRIYWVNMENETFDYSYSFIIDKHNVSERSLRVY